MHVVSQGKGNFTNIWNHRVRRLEELDSDTATDTVVNFRRTLLAEQVKSRGSSDAELASIVHRGQVLRDKVVWRALSFANSANAIRYRYREHMITLSVSSRDTSLYAPEIFDSASVEQMNEQCYDVKAKISPPCQIFRALNDFNDERFLDERLRRRMTLCGTGSATAACGCARGEYNEAVYSYDVQTCEACPLGKLTPEPGYYTEEECVPYETCPAGKYNGEHFNASSCVSCPRGTYSDPPAGSATA